MKKFLTSFLFSLILISLTLGVVNFALATPATPPTGAAPVNDVETILGPSGLSNFAGRYHRLSSTDPGADQITSLIFYVVDFIKYVLGGIAVLYLIVVGVKLIAAGKKVDEVSEKAKENLKYIIFGLLLVITADELVTKVFFGDYGECWESTENAQECAGQGSSLIKGIYSLILSVIASLAVLVLVISAFRLITAYGNEETIKKETGRLKYSIAGILVAAMGEFVVKRLIFRDGGTEQIDIRETQRLIYKFINFLSAFIGAGAFAMLFYGGYLYVVSYGNDEQTGKAKKIIMGAFIGIIIAIAAFGIVTTVTSFTSGREVPLPGAPSLPATTR